MHTRDQIETALRVENLDFDVLETDGGWALVAPELGAKVLAAGVDRESLFWVSTSLSKDSWCVGGQRTWLAPELGDRGFFGTSAQDWTVPPELDPGRYRRIEAPTGELAARCDLTIKRLDGRTFTLGIVRSIGIEPISVKGCVSGLRIRVGSRLINAMDRELEAEVGLWNIVQTPAEVTGTFLIPLRSSNLPEPNHRVYRLYFGDLPADWVVETPNLLYPKARAGRWFKIGIPPTIATGSLGYLRPSRVDDEPEVRHTLVVLRSAAEPAARYVDKPPFQQVGNGDVFQCYNSPDEKQLNFCELEAHAPAIVLGPGEVQDTYVEILLFKAGLEELQGVCRQFMSTEMDTERLFLD